MLKRLSGLSRIQRVALLGVTLLALVGLIGASLLIALPKLAQAQARTNSQPNRALTTSPFAHMTGAQALDALAKYTTIPLWGTSINFGRGNGTFPYMMLGTNPVKGGVATIPIEIIPVSLKIAGDTFDGASRVNDVVNSPLFQLSDYPDGRAQYLDAVQRGNWWHYAHTNNYHLLLGTPTIEPTLSLTVPAADGTVTGQTATVNATWWSNALAAAVSQSSISSKALPIFLTRNLYFGNQLGLYGYSVHTSNLNFYVSASYFDCLNRLCPSQPNVYSGTEQDVLALSQTLVEFSYNPFGLTFENPGFDPAAPASYPTNFYPFTWSSPLAYNNTCGFYFDPLEAPLFTSLTALTTVGGITRLYHLADVAYTSWFFHQSPSFGYGGHYDFMGLRLFNVYGPASDSGYCCEIFCDAYPPSAAGSNGAALWRQRILTH